MPHTRYLPDPDLHLRDATDFIMGGPLGRSASRCGLSDFNLILRDLIEAIHRLVQSCHLPEFTDHGLSHLCSLIDRINTWENSDGKGIPEELSDHNAAILLLATLFHDLGMLSQRAEDLPEVGEDWALRSRWGDTATWVRQTHVVRLPKLARRILQGLGYTSFCSTPFLDEVIQIACAHQKWPWEWKGSWQQKADNRCLAAIVAVSDLLDEDAARCDTSTLIRHREGSPLNYAHWLRHLLTAGRITVKKSAISISMVRFHGVTVRMLPVYSALRNHFRLVSLYNDELGVLGFQIGNIKFNPCTGMPSQEDGILEDWHTIDGYSTENALCAQLLSTFMAEVTKNARRCSPESLRNLPAAALEDVDTSSLDSHARTEPVTSDEIVASALMREAP